MPWYIVKWEFKHDAIEVPKREGQELVQAPDMESAGRQAQKKASRKLFGTDIMHHCVRIISIEKEEGVVREAAPTA